MAFESFGLGGFLTFDVKGAIANMGAAEEKFKGLQKGAGKVQGALGDMGGAAAGISAAAAGVAVGIGAGTKVAADFEQALANIRAAAPEVTAEQMSAIAVLSKDMGAKTSFSAKQAAEGMNELVRAGIDVKDAMTALPGVLAAAEAEGMDLGRAASIVSQIMSSLGEKDTNRIADALAAGSAASLSSIVGLGEAFTYGAAGARKMGMNVNEATAVFGALSNAGLDASMAGTSFTTMVNGLVSPTDKAKSALDTLKVSMVDSAGKFRPIADVIDEIQKKLTSVTDIEKRAAIQGDLFTNGAERAFSALANNLHEPDKGLIALNAKLKQATGAATVMASVRMNTLTGEIERAQSATEGLILELFGPAIPAFRSMMIGVGSAVDWLRNSFIALPESVRNGIGTAIAVVGVLAVVIAGVAGVAAAVLIGLGSIIGSVVSLGLAWGFIGPLLILLGKVILVFGLIAFAVTALWGQIKAFFVGFYASTRFYFEFLSDSAMYAFGMVKEAWNYLVETFSSGTNQYGADWTKIGKIVGIVVNVIIAALGYLLQVASWVFAGIILAVSQAIKMIRPFLNLGIAMVGGLADAFIAFADGRIVQGLALLGASLLDLVLMPLRSILTAAFAVSDALGIQIPDGLRQFVEGGLVSFVRESQTPIGQSMEADADVGNARAEKENQSMETMSMEVAGALKGVKIDNKVEVKLDGRKVASSVARHNLDISEREGASLQPYQRRKALDHGAVPLRG